LSFNKIGDEGFQCLMEALNRGRGCQRVTMCQSKIGAASLVAAIGLLEKWQDVQLNLMWNAFPAFNGKENLKAKCKPFRDTGRLICEFGESAQETQGALMLLDPEDVPFSPAMRLKSEEKLDFEELKAIGFGSYGTVYCLDESKVVKKLFSISTSSKKVVMEDLKLWTQLEHDNIVRCFGADSTPSAENDQVEVRFVMERFDGTLQSYLRENTDISIIARLDILRQIASGLHFLHGIHLEHGDLDGNNILTKQTADSVRVAISDFGISKTLRFEDSKHRGSIITLDLEGPEETGYSKDVHSFGFLIWQVMTNRDIAQDFKIAQANHMHPADWISSASKDLYHFKLLSQSKPEKQELIDEVLTIMGSCLISNPLDRPNAAVLETEFSRLKETSESISKLREINGSNLPISSLSIVPMCSVCSTFKFR
jgi:serine/threonine protein kinase